MNTSHSAKDISTNPHRELRISSFDRDLLKAIALLAMVADHILLYSDLIAPNTTASNMLSALGRCAFPLFAALAAFSISEASGVSDLPRMAKRLFLWGLLAQVSLQASAYLHVGQSQPVLLNVLFSFWFSIGFVWLAKSFDGFFKAKGQGSDVLKAAFIVALAVVFVPHTEYGWSGVIAGPAAYLVWICARHTIPAHASWLFFILWSTAILSWYNAKDGTLLVLPILGAFLVWLHLGQKLVNKPTKRFFPRHFLYAFYALHTLPIALL